jgi:hypothetical protein
VEEGLEGRDMEKEVTKKANQWAEEETIQIKIKATMVGKELLVILVGRIWQIFVTRRMLRGRSLRWLQVLGLAYALVPLWDVIDGNLPFYKYDCTGVQTSYSVSINSSLFIIVIPNSSEWSFPLQRNGNPAEFTKRFLVDLGFRAFSLEKGF